MERILLPDLMEPLLPPPGSRRLEDLAVELIARNASLAGKISKETVGAVSKLVRSMNCYYSNLIEGHNTHPVDIERALNGEYSKEPAKRNLQLEAFAHIEVQALIDSGDVELSRITSWNYISWLHKEFCKRLPEELLTSRDPEAKKEVQVLPGALRSDEVIVGNHLAPVACELPKFLALFERRYNAVELSALMRVIAVPAAHHRLLWIHPFVDGNGRVARLFSHAFLKTIGAGSGLWSTSRGLARNVSEYKERLAGADRWREHDTDGRGSLSLAGLIEFCEFFLTTCIDQVKFMETLLEPGMLTERVREYCAKQVQIKALPRGSFELLRELILSGSVARARVPSITNYQERQSRTIVSELIKRGLLQSESTRAELRLHIPYNVVESWFPRLYPPLQPGAL
jgi:Fic family protein